MLEQITRSIQLLKMKILKYSSQRYILETYEEAFNTYRHYLDLRQTVDNLSGFLVPLLRHLPGNYLSRFMPNIPAVPSLNRTHQELLLCMAAATVTMSAPPVS